MDDNVSKFLPFLSNSNLTEEEKIEVLQVLYRLVEAQIDAAFGQHPTQLAGGKGRENDLHKSSKSLDSKVSHISQHYRQAANDDSPAVLKGGQKNASGQ